MPSSKDLGYLRSFANKNGQRYVDLHYFPKESWKRENPYLNKDVADLFKLRKPLVRYGPAYNEISNAINFITRKNREYEFNEIDCPWIPQLTFDLHNFTCIGALTYVQEIVKKMKEKRLVHGDETIILITGKGDDKDENEATIKNKLLKKYVGQIEIDGKNAGRLNLTLRKKMVYASCIPTYLFS